MARSQNGWSASTNLNIVPLVIDGVGFLPGVRAGDTHTVLEYVARQVNDRVEKAVNPGCWGFFFRANRNDPNSLSNHSSGTAIDFNAPKHPNGVATSRTWSARQIREIHKILGEVDGVVRWGGDFTRTVDAMHFEINADAAAVAKVAQKIRAGHLGAPQEESVMPLSKADAQLIADALLDSEVTNKNPDGTTGKGKVGAILTNIEVSQEKQFNRVYAKLDEIATLLEQAVNQGKSESR